MELRQFTYVNKVAECGSFTKAAAALFISQPALSNYINTVVFASFNRRDRNGILRLTPGWEKRGCIFIVRREATGKRYPYLSICMAADL